MPDCGLFSFGPSSFGNSVGYLWEVAFMMNAEQKERIARLRDNGAGYTEIANALGLPVNTVKTFCRRNGLTGDRRDMQPKKKSKGSRTIDLLYRKTRGNTTVPEGDKSLENTCVSGVPAVCTITLSFADSPDETAVADVMNMLMTADYSSGVNNANDS